MLVVVAVVVVVGTVVGVGMGWYPMGIDNTSRRDYHHWRGRLVLALVLALILVQDQVEDHWMKHMTSLVRSNHPLLALALVLVLALTLTLIPPFVGIPMHELS